MLNNKTVLITGGTGSLGKRLIRKIFSEYKPAKVIVFSRDEFKQSEMARDFDYSNLRFFLGDVRDKARLYSVFSGVDYVIHAAALKQIPALEYNPTEAVKTNIIGSMNVIEACIEKGVEKAVLTSTDKAVNPVNLYGATKLAAEKLFLAANTYNKTEFVAVRYGNVIGSRGSVIPLFEKLKKEGTKEFPITDERMTRFWITLDEAVELVLIALRHAKGKIVVPRIPSMKITEIARAIEPNCTFREIGIRSGEKLHEKIISEDNKNVAHIGFDDTIYTSEPLSSDTNPLWLGKKEFLEKWKSSVESQ